MKLSRDMKLMKLQKQTSVYEGIRCQMKEKKNMFIFSVCIFYMYIFVTIPKVVYKRISFKK